MSKTWVIIKREFTEFVQTRTFLLMTILGPLLMAGFIGLQVLIFSRAGGGSYSLAIVDETAESIGPQVAALLQTTEALPGMGKPVTFTTSIIQRPANTTGVQDSLVKLVAADSLSGFLVIPAGAMTGDTALYYGRNATNTIVTLGIQRALQRAVQSGRLAREGIDTDKLTTALAPVSMESQKIGKRGFEGSARARQTLGYIMIFALYLVTLLYGQAIMNSVLEEKRDKIVEVIVSSTSPRDLLIGKVIGIGAGGFLQMLIWVVFAGLGMAYAGKIAQLFNLSPENSAAFTGLAANLPQVPISVGVLYLLFFLAGFFIYSTMFAMIGSMVTNNQEAQQLVFPTILPFVIGMFIALTTLTNPDGSMATIGSLFPLTAPIVMPARTVLGTVPAIEIVASLLLTFAAGYGILWVAGKIYRIGIFATGTRPSLREVVRWIRAA